LEARSYSDRQISAPIRMTVGQQGVGAGRCRTVGQRTEVQGELAEHWPAAAAAAVAAAAAAVAAVRSMQGSCAAATEISELTSRRRLGTE